MAPKDEILATVEESVDLNWPEVNESQNTDESDTGFGMHVNELLTSKGWCLMKMPSNEEVRQGVLSQAEQLTFDSPRAELAADLLGTHGSGKVCHMQPGATTAFFASYDNSITELCDSIQPYALHSMDFRVDSRTEGMVWTQFSSLQEEKSMKQTPLSDDDVEYGLLEAHLNFIQRRKLCCLYFLNTDGGKICLRSKSEEGTTVELAVSSDMLLVFRCDEMTFQHVPNGDFTIYQAWIMDSPQENEFQGMLADPSHRAKLQGIMKGVSTPLGPRIMVQALETCVGGSSNDSHANWSSFVSGTDGMIYVPKCRFDTDLYFVQQGPGGVDPCIPGVNSYHVHGGMMDDPRLFAFDHEFFGIKDPEEARCIWPKQRLVLDVGYSCLVQAGYDRQSLHGRNIGFYVGDSGGGDWFSILFSSIVPAADKDIISTFTSSTTASRLGFTFGMRGPTAGIDTACSSGLTAFSVGAVSLRKSQQGQFQEFGCRVPLEGNMCGGCQTIISGSGYVATSAANMVSHDGRCFTYNASADGYARGEGCSLVLSKFETDEDKKDDMVACVLGVCSNQDGRSATITAPNGPAQTACTLASLKEGRITSGEVGASECHGTGTPLGDPIEVGALIAVHGQSRGGSAFGMTSTKSNIGHMEENAGAAGMFKCILMAKYAVCTPNCHLRTMNSNLVHGGFPALFDTENIDANLNSFISGVSSFGFGGANAHAEFWARSTFGGHKVDKYIPLESYDQLTVTCPVTMGQIDHLTGEPAVEFDRTEAPTKVKADVLRDALADYGISRHAYKGGFRFRAAEDDDEEDEYDNGELPEVSVCGSWSGFGHMDPMEKQGKGIYTTTVILGITRCEYFYMCVNGDPTMKIYPVVNNASPNIAVKGPNDQCDGQYWLIDGRDLETPQGTPFKISFSWGKFRKTVSWEIEPLEKVTKTALSISSHTYSLAGSWNSYQHSDLTPSAEVPNRWEGSFKISELGKDYFQIVRDHSAEQIIYPSMPNTTSTEVPVRGPDAWGAGKYWLVEGEPDEIVPVHVQENDGSIEVEVGLQVWESVEGWARHDYFLKTLTNPECAKMTMSEPGIFKCVGAISDNYSYEQKGYVDCFQILVDEDPNYCFYPAIPNARSGKQITYPPSGQNLGHCWLISSLSPGVNYEVTFDLTAKDRRRMVTWKLL